MLPNPQQTLSWLFCWAAFKQPPLDFTSPRGHKSMKTSTISPSSLCLCCGLLLWQILQYLSLFKSLENRALSKHHRGQKEPCLKKKKQQTAERQCGQDVPVELPFLLSTIYNITQICITQICFTIHLTHWVWVTSLEPELWWEQVEKTAA